MYWLQKFRALIPQEIRGPIAVLYDKTTTPGLSEFYRQVAAEVTSSLQTGQVLDVGTGPGHLLTEIARRNPNLKLVGFDLSPTMLKIAKKRIRGPAIRLIPGDVRNLPFDDDTFEVVVSTISMHHWHDPARGIRECLRVTAPGGHCWIYDLRSDASAMTHARLITGKWLRRLLLGMIFKFHGVNPKDYEACTVASWLGDGVTVQIQMFPAYLKLNMKKSDG